MLPNKGSEQREPRQPSRAGPDGRQLDPAQEREPALLGWAAKGTTNLPQPWEEAQPARRGLQALTANRQIPETGRDTQGHLPPPEGCVRVCVRA